MTIEKINRANALLKQITNTERSISNAEFSNVKRGILSDGILVAISNLDGSYKDNILINEVIYEKVKSLMISELKILLTELNEEFDNL